MREINSAIELIIRECDGTESRRMKVMGIKVDRVSDICNVTYLDNDRFPFTHPEMPPDLEEEGITSYKLASRMIGFVDLGSLRCRKKKEVAMYKIYPI